MCTIERQLKTLNEIIDSQVAILFSIIESLFSVCG